MAERCGCGCGHAEGGSTRGTSGERRAITADMTVEAIMRAWPSTVAVLKDRGVNHCCGAHLPLGEAAAAAGAPLADLLRALNEAAATAPV